MIESAAEWSISNYGTPRIATLDHDQGRKTKRIGTFYMQKYYFNI